MVIIQIVLLSLIGVTVILFFGFWFFACIRSCCTMCKKDITRTDYRKHEKLKPGFWNLLFTTIAFGLVALTLYQFINMWYFFANTFCQAMNFLQKCYTQFPGASEQYNKAIRIIERIFEPILYTNLTFIVVTLICYLLSLIVICCVMVTKKRKYKNVSHISWISGVTTLLVATIIGCTVVFGILQIWDACQVYEYSEKNRTVTGLDTFYPPTLQTLLDACVYPPNALKSGHGLVLPDFQNVK